MYPSLRYRQDERFWNGKKIDAFIRIVCMWMRVEKDRERERARERHVRRSPLFRDKRRNEVGASAKSTRIRS